MNLAQSTKEEKPQEVEWSSFCIYNVASFIDFREGEISITFILVAAIFIGQQVYEGIAVQNNISNIAHIVGGIVGAIIVYGLNVKAKYGLYR